MEQITLTEKNGAWLATNPAWISIMGTDTIETAFTSIMPISLVVEKLADINRGCMISGGGYNLIRK